MEYVIILCPGTLVYSCFSMLCHWTAPGWQPCASHLYFVLRSHVSLRELANQKPGCTLKYPIPPKIPCIRSSSACSVGWFVSLLVREEVLLAGLCERKILFRLEIYDCLRQATAKRTGCLTWKPFSHFKNDTLLYCGYMNMKSMAILFTWTVEFWLCIVFPVYSLR